MVEKIKEKLKNKITFKQLKQLMLLMDAQNFAEAQSEDRYLLLLCKFDGNEEATKLFLEILTQEEVDKETVQNATGAELLELYVFFFEKFLEESGLLKNIQNRSEAFLTNIIEKLKTR